MTIDLNEYLKNSYNQAILSKLNKLPLSKEEIEQSKLICLWDSIRTYDSSRSSFQTHLYNNCKFTLLKAFGSHKKQKTRYKNISVEKFYSHCYNLLDFLPRLYKSFIDDRFIQKLTIHQMSKKYCITQKMVYNILQESIREVGDYYEIRSC